MQRFKREFILRLRAPAGSELAHLGKVARMAVASNDDKKFVYGSNGTLTQNARWRREAFDTMEMLRYNTNAAWAAIEVSRISNLLQAARHGGFRLP